MVRSTVSLGVATIWMRMKLEVSGYSLLVSENPGETGYESPIESRECDDHRLRDKKKGRRGAAGVRLWNAYE